MLALIVDDDHVHQRIHKMCLKHFEIESVLNGNGKEAVDLSDAGVNFDLILMDMEMPVMDGLEATTALRAMGFGGMIAGVASRSLKADRDAFLAAGAYSVYAKPLNLHKAADILTEYYKMTP